jgi:dihydrofolate synthase / folylpolyglutamate synthase
MVFMPHWPYTASRQDIIKDLRLDRMEILLEQVGNPEKTLPPVVHVAGTNGKGSTIAFMRSIFEEAGYKVHVYTSPHILRFNERIVIAGNEISDSYLFETLEEVRIAAEGLKLEVTFFEGVTVAAFLAFSRNQADVLLLETGLGGRLDATNVIKHPAMTVLTTISLDHTDYLGNDVRLITHEKAGILKRGCPCVMSQQYLEVDKIITGYAAKLDIDLYAYEYEWCVVKKENGFEYKSSLMDLKLPEPSLHGDHQYVNAGNAISACLKLKGFIFGKDDYIEGIVNAKWPGRLQNINKGYLYNTLPKGWDIWIDGAHNEAGAFVLSNWVAENDKLPTYLVCGMTKGRNVREFLAFFKSKVRHVCGIMVQSEPLSHVADVITDEAKALGIDACTVSSIEDAIDKITTSFVGPGRILFCGSLFLTGDVLTKNQLTVTN